jgi:hypothetical protein
MLLVVLVFISDEDIILYTIIGYNIFTVLLDTALLDTALLDTALLVVYITLLPQALQPGFILFTRPIIGEDNDKLLNGKNGV